MFSMKPAKTGSFSTRQSITSSKHRAGKSSSNKTRRSFKDQAALTEKAKRLTIVEPHTPPADTASSPVVTIAVGAGGRLFACHESVLCNSPYFASICRSQYLESSGKQIVLPDEIPEVFSSILEYLYKGDYYPRLEYNKRRSTWALEGGETNNGGRGALESTVYDARIDHYILKDTVLYCSADRYGLDKLKKLALQKQGLQSGIQCSTILASARYAYDNTPENDAKLRAHYLALIIRSRNTFKRSGTLQNQMETGGKMFFDLFVAMCNHMDDISSITKSPR